MRWTGSLGWVVLVAILVAFGLGGLGCPAPTPQTVHADLPAPSPAASPAAETPEPPAQPFSAADAGARAVPEAERPAPPLPPHEAWLEYVDGRTGRARIFPVDTAKVVRVGRASPQDGTPEVDLSTAFDGRTVSRRHAEIMRRDGAWVLFIQPDTTNRSMLNDELIERGSLHRLKHGDEIQLGAVLVVFRTRRGAEAEAERKR